MSKYKELVLFHYKNGSNFRDINIAKEIIDGMKIDVNKQLSWFDVNVALAKKEGDLERLKNLQDNLKTYEEAGLSEYNKFLNQIDPKLKDETLLHFNSTFNKIKVPLLNQIRKTEENIKNELKEVAKKSKIFQIPNVKLQVGNIKKEVPKNLVKITNGEIAVLSAIIAAIIIMCSYMIYRDEKEKTERELKKKNISNAEKIARVKGLEKQINVLQSSGHNFKYADNPRKVYEIVISKIKELKFRRQKIISNSLKKG